MQPFDLGIAFMIGCRSIADGIRDGMKSHAIHSHPLPIPYQPSVPVYDEETPDKLMAIIERVAESWENGWDLNEGKEVLDKMHNCLRKLIGKISQYDFDRLLAGIAMLADLLYKLPIESSESK